MVAKKNPKIFLFQGVDKKWYFHKRSRNGRIVGDSQGYKQKRYAKVAIAREHPDIPVVEVNYGKEE